MTWPPICPRLNTGTLVPIGWQRAHGFMRSPIQVRLRKGFGFLVYFERLASRAQPPMLTMLEVRGVTRRGIWIRIYHSVYVIETTLGSAYLYPPQEDGAAKLVLKTESSISPGHLVKLSEEVLAKL